MAHYLYSLIIPVYKNQESIPSLLSALEHMSKSLENQLEVIFVVDGSPDQSFALLKEKLPATSFKSQLLLLSRNFGAYSAIRAGLTAAQGNYFAVMAADLQEPPELIPEFFHTLTTEPVDVVFGMRKSRKDPIVRKSLSNLFWFFYKKLVIPDMPPGGIDIFGCNTPFRNQLLELNELNSSLIGLAFWLGFRRKLVSYHRAKREHGKSAWSLKKRLKYATDSIFAFSEFPIKFLYFIGMLGLATSCFSAIIVLFAKLSGSIAVPGYTGTIITIVFFAALNSMGLGIIGSYVWRAFENTKFRPHSIVMSTLEFN